jgi:hypothetical protein
LTVREDSPSAAAVSSTLMPPKNRGSTTSAARASTFSKREIISSSATICDESCSAASWATLAPSPARAAVARFAAAVPAAPGSGVVDQDLAQRLAAMAKNYRRLGRSTRWRGIFRYASCIIAVGWGVCPADCVPAPRSHNRQDTMGGEAFRGNIDELRISDVALSPEQFLAPEPASFAWLAVGGTALRRR